MKRKITKVKDYHGVLMDTLSDVLAEHFPLPGQSALGAKKKKVCGGAIPWDCATLDSTAVIENASVPNRCSFVCSSRALFQIMERIWSHSARSSRYLRTSAILLNILIIKCVFFSVPIIGVYLFYLFTAATNKQIPGNSSRALRDNRRLLLAAVHRNASPVRNCSQTPGELQ